jgi:YVTN family beta-propeller protein
MKAAGRIGGLLALCTVLVPTAAYQQREVQKELRAYITNSGSNSVSVIRVADDTVINTITVGKGPFGVAATPDGSKVYIANTLSSTISVIDTLTNKVISTLAVENAPRALALSPQGHRLYIVHDRFGMMDYARISVVDTVENAVAHVSSDPLLAKHGVAISPDGSQVYISNFGGNDLLVFDAQEFKRVKTVPLGQLPDGVAVSADGAHLYVANHAEATLSVLTSKDLTEVKRVVVGDGPFAIALLPQAHKAYVTLQGTVQANNKVVVFDTVKNETAGTISVGRMPMGIAITPDNRKIYVANKMANTVSVIDPTQDKVVTTIAVEDSPIALGSFICAVPIPQA